MKLNTYQKTAITTVGATIFLILVGGLVRATGAGLGCPDWPTCFGMWVPPTSAAQLPPGFDHLQFNVVKTWTEYLNRLTGVIIGLLITATAFLSFRYRKTKPSVFYSSILAFILVLFNGWLGGRVVETGLAVHLITIHMVLAMIIMAALLYAAFESTSQRWLITIPPKAKQNLYWLSLVLLVFTLVQLILGTEIREGIDIIKYVTPRDLWISKIGAIDEIHRSFAWTVLLISLAVFFITRRKTESPLLNKLSIYVLGFVLLQIVFGVILYYLGMPSTFQVLHLVGVAFLICFEVLYLLVIKKAVTV